MEAVSFRGRLSRLVASPWAALGAIAALTLVAIFASTQAGGNFVFIIALAGWSFWTALPAATLLGAVTGGLLALPALRVSGPYLAMMTIAFAFIVECGAIEWRDLTGGQNGPMGFPSPEAFGRMFLEMEMAILVSILAGLSLAAYCVLARGRWGLAMRAVSDSDVAAQSVGIDPLRVTTLAFILSAALAAMAGGLFRPLQGFISPGSFPFFQSILFLPAVVVGGSRTLLGPVLGVLATVLLPELLSSLAEYRLLFFGGLMLGVLLAAPRGMMGLIQKVLLVEDPRRASPSDRGLAELVGREGPARPLEATGLTISFGGVQAARNVSFKAEPGRITSIIGPNGAGKTTVLNMIGGFCAPDAGSIRLEGDLAGKSAWTAARAGIARTYQTTLLFQHMSVLDNVLTADAGRALEVPFGPPPARGPRRCWPSSASPARSGARPARCRMSTAGWSKSPARSPPAVASCCWTRRRRGWHPPWCASCSTHWPICATKA